MFNKFRMKLLGKVIGVQFLLMIAVIILFAVPVYSSLFWIYSLSLGFQMVATLSILAVIFFLIVFQAYWFFIHRRLIERIANYRVKYVRDFISQHFSFLDDHGYYTLETGYDTDSIEIRIHGAIAHIFFSTKVPESVWVTTFDWELKKYDTTKKLDGQFIKKEDGQWVSAENPTLPYSAQKNFEHRHLCFEFRKGLFATLFDQATIKRPPCIIRVARSENTFERS